MEIRYTLTLEDYAEGSQMLALSTTFRRKLNYYLFLRFGLVTGFSFLLLAIGLSVLTPIRPGSSIALAVNGITGVFLWIGLVAIISPFTYRRRLKRSFRDQKFPCELRLMTIDQGIAISRADGTSEDRFNWAAFDKALETNRIFVLFPNARQLVAIPKRVMTPEQQLEFRDRIARHIPGIASTPTLPDAVS
jgi:hypothetical protein